MRSFDYSLLANKTWDSEILSLVAAIHEHKGRQNLYLNQKPVELERLVVMAKAQSTESSNWIEGIVTTSARFKQLMTGRTMPRNRDEDEILGYQNVLNLIHENYEVIPPTGNYILQLHKELLKYTPHTYAGHFKTTPNEIDAVNEDGTKTVLFRPLEPYETPDAIHAICESFSQALANEYVDALILIPCFLLDFLCIHPFADGNGRMSRLLTLLLLCRSGYLVGRYISLEKAIAETKNEYYAALASADADWHEGKNDPKAFIKYMLSIVLSCYKAFEARVSLTERTGRKSTSLDIVRHYVENKLGVFTKREVLESCPALGSSSVEAALMKLVREKTIQKIGVGKATHYVKTT